MLQFNDVLELADKLPLDEQEELSQILHRRVIEQRREEILSDIRSARKEFAEGKISSMTPEELMKELLK
jgi:hypothetical protein